MSAPEDPSKRHAAELAARDEAHTAELASREELHARALAARDDTLREEVGRRVELEKRLGPLERDHRRAEDVKQERLGLVERHRQVSGLIEQVVCSCGESQCPRCAALELLQS